MKEGNVPAIKVAVLLFEGVELLDFAGPAEVFASTEGFQVFTVGLSEEPVSSQQFLSINPKYTIANCPKADIIIVPGGEVEYLIENQELICWLRASTIHALHLLSVCKGAGLLAAAGLLNQREATTQNDFKPRLQELAPDAIILPNARITDNGQVITTAGTSSGIDGALHLLARLKGKNTAHQTANFLEYKNWNTHMAD